MTPVPPADPGPPAPDPAGGPPPPSEDEWRFRCPDCGTRLVVSTAELIRHVQTRMPVCDCGRVMELAELPWGDAPG